MNGTLHEVVAIVCGGLLVALVLALIFSTKFRDDVLGGEGEASVAGILTVKGVAIVLLCGLFLGGMIYPLSMVPQPVGQCNEAINDVLSPLPAFSDDLAPDEVVKAVNEKLSTLNGEKQLLQATVTSCEEAKEGTEAEKRRLDKALQDEQGKLRNCNLSLRDYEQGTKGVLAKLNIIQDDIQKFSPAIDFAYVPDNKDKQDAAYRVLEVLGRLGHYEYAPSRDPDKARAALISFQRLKNILPDDPKKQGLLGRRTFLLLIDEYIASEANSA